RVCLTPPPSQMGEAGRGSSSFRSSPHPLPRGEGGRDHRERPGEGAHDLKAWQRFLFPSPIADGGGREGVFPFHPLPLAGGAGGGSRPHPLPGERVVAQRPGEGAHDLKASQRFFSPSPIADGGGREGVFLFPPPTCKRGRR